MSNIEFGCTASLASAGMGLAVGGQGFGGGDAQMVDGLAAGGQLAHVDLPLARGVALLDGGEDYRASGIHTSMYDSPRLAQA